MGSLAHDERYAFAGVASASRLLALGVDIEPALPLPDEVAAIALSARERASVGEDRIAFSLIFAAKEAVYKAINPLDGSALEYEDIDIDLGAGVATLVDGRRVEMATHRGERLLAVARIRNG